MDEVKFGACKFCGQCNWDMDCTDCITVTEANSKATEICACDEAKAYTARLKKYEATVTHIDDLFGAGAVEKELVSVNSNVLTYLYACAERIAYSDISAVSVQVARGCQAKLSTNSKGQIKVERVEVGKYQQQE
ncbi:MAG: hypothetical protein ACYCWE_21010 [Eubacteriales bacterium]